MPPPAQVHTGLGVGWVCPPCKDVNFKNCSLPSTATSRGIFSRSRSTGRKGLPPPCAWKKLFWSRRLSPRTLSHQGEVFPHGRTQPLQQRPSLVLFAPPQLRSVTSGSHHDPFRGSKRGGWHLSSRHQGFGGLPANGPPIARLVTEHHGEGGRVPTPRRDGREGRTRNGLIECACGGWPALTGTPILLQGLRGADTQTSSFRGTVLSLSLTLYSHTSVVEGWVRRCSGALAAPLTSYTSLLPQCVRELDTLAFRRAPAFGPGRCHWPHAQNHSTTPTLFSFL